MPREKSRYRDRDRRSSSHSSESSYDRKKSKSKHKRRSRSRDRSESSSHKRRRSASRSRRGRRSYSRSLSRDRYESKSSRRRSTSRSRAKASKRSHSRSSSRSKTKHSRRHRKRSKSSGSRSSFEIERPQPQKVNLDDAEVKLEKAIKAAEAVGLTMTRIPTYEYKEVEIKEDMPTITDRNLLAELNSDSFVPKSFTSSRSKKQNIVIDLDSQTVTVPEAEVKAKQDDSIIDFDALPSEEELKEMWIKKMYLYRKKMLKGEL